MPLPLPLKKQPMFHNETKNAANANVAVKTALPDKAISSKHRLPERERARRSHNEKKDTHRLKQPIPEKICMQVTMYS